VELEDPNLRDSTGIMDMEEVLEATIQFFIVFRCYDNLIFIIFFK
jgi:hypothetical protein